MTATPRTRALAAIAAGSLSLTVLSGSGAEAAGDIVVGDLFTPTEIGCNGETYFQNEAFDQSYEVPKPGVVTSFRTTIGAVNHSAVAFKLGRQDGANGFKVTASGPLAVPPSANAVFEQRVRLPAAAGDVLGMYFGAGTNDPCAIDTSFGGFDDGFVSLSGNAPADGISYFTTTAYGFRFPIEATLEPDADRDVYGDTTQDSCDTDPTTQAACATSRPQTTITAARATRRGRVTVTFRASETATFRCSVDSAALRPCRSPYVTRLKPGRHRIVVVATDRYRNVDPTAAVTTVKVKKPRKKKRR